MRVCAVSVVGLVLAGGCSGAPSPEVEQPDPARKVQVIEAAPVEAPRVGMTLPTAVLGSPRQDPAQGWTPPATPDPAPVCPETVDGVPIADTDAADPRLRGAKLVIVSKSDRRLWLFEAGELKGCWPIGLGFSPAGDKEREGDGRTPQGWYRTSDKPWSTFDGAIAIHYPNRDDARRAEARGDITRRTRRRIDAALREGSVPPQRTAMGGAVLIHGGGSSADWTLGCVALDDDDLEELRGRLPASKKVDLLVVP